MMPIPFENIRIATPCSADWNEMDGDARVRHCELCMKNVYNLSEMTRAEAEALIKEKEGHLCVRYYQRPDGTVLTEDCPVALRAIRRRLRWIGAGVAALFTFAVGIFAHAQSNSANGSGGATRRSAVRLFGWLSPPAPPPVMGKPCIMGVLKVRPVPVALPAANQNSGSVTDE
jgi:hypothetical protein